MVRSWKIVDAKSEKVINSGQNPVESLFWGLFWLDKKPFTLTCITQPTKKSESQRVILVGRSNWNILYLSPLCQTLSNAFSISRKVHVIFC